MMLRVTIMLCCLVMKEAGSFTNDFTIFGMPASDCKCIHDVALQGSLGSFAC